MKGQENRAAEKAHRSLEADSTVAGFIIHFVLMWPSIALMGCKEFHLSLCYLEKYL